MGSAVFSLDCCRSMIALMDVCINMTTILCFNGIKLYSFRSIKMAHLILRSLSNYLKELEYGK